MPPVIPLAASAARLLIHVAILLSADVSANLKNKVTKANAQKVLQTLAGK